MNAALEREYVDYVQARLATLRRTAYELCGDAHRGDDLVQQTITKLYLHWRKARLARNLDAYSPRILVRAFLDERRLRWARVHLFAAAPEPDGTPPGGDVEDRMVLRDALARLPRRLRAVLVLRFIADLSVYDVAEILECSPGTVKSQTFRGLAEMRRLLGLPLRAGTDVLDKGE
jgi:RNA polymerase sigma-70 factor (sigma-E family)